MELVITSLNMEEIADSSFFRVDYFLKSESIENYNLNFRIYDPFFDVMHTPGEITVSAVSNGTIYWVGFDIDKLANGEKPNLKFGFRLVVEDLDNKNIIYDKKHFHSPENWKNKIIEESGGKKICWIIGDSHAWECFGGYEHRPLEIGGYFPVRISVTSLSLNKFIRGEYIKFLNDLPIKKEDVLVFILAGSDFNYTIYKHCLDKGKKLREVCLKLMNDYFECIRRIKSERKNQIVLMSPLPPMREGFLKKYILGSEEDRILAWNVFHNFWISKSKEVEYLDWTKKYKLEDGMIDTEMMMYSDHHIKDYYHCISELSYRLRHLNN